VRRHQTNKRSATRQIRDWRMMVYANYIRAAQWTRERNALAHQYSPMIDKVIEALR
jgi:hypothetical protein